MYDWPEVQTDTDKFWATLRFSLLDFGFTDLPLKLTRNNNFAHCLGRNTGLTQTCGYPLKHELGSSVDLLGTPTYAVDYCKEGFYASVILIRKDDLRNTFSEFKGAIPAINGINSQSGYNALRNCTHDMMKIPAEHFFATPLISGSHRQSIISVSRRQADLCAIDPVSWQLAQCFQKEGSQLRVLCHTQFTPALPLVCSEPISRRFSGSLGCGPDALRKTVMRAWREAIGCDPTTAKNLFLEDITSIERNAYLAVPTLD